MSDLRSILTRNDKILMAALLAAALLSALPAYRAVATSADGARALVIVGGMRYTAVSLSTNRTLSVPTKVGDQLLRVSDGRIRVIEAPCPRKICRHGGWIRGSGQELVCVPGEMIVRIEGGGKPGVDAVSR